MKYDSSLLPQDITRKKIIEYLNFLTTKEISIVTRRTAIIHLRTFHQLVMQEKWLPLPFEPLVFSSDIPNEVIKIPRFIPETVISQLNENLDYLPTPLQRLITIMLETGRRISEVCSLEYGCIEQDHDGDWLLKVEETKMKKCYFIPISQACVSAIKSQQDFIKKNENISGEYLFPSRRKAKSKHVTARQVNRALKILAHARNVKDENGKIWNFHTHQFRHTVGTRMINAGVSQHIVQRYLGHESPDMTARYAYIHDSTLKRAFTEYYDKMIDIQGEFKIVTSDHKEASWLKNNIMAQALPNGICSLPLAQQRCPHANACLTCAHFRTNKSFISVHQQQLEKTNQIIEIAKTNGWQRQIEMNAVVKNNLEKIINKLQEDEND